MDTIPALIALQLYSFIADLRAVKLHRQAHIPGSNWLLYNETDTTLDRL